MFVLSLQQNGRRSFWGSVTLFVQHNADFADTIKPVLKGHSTKDKTHYLNDRW